MSRKKTNKNIIVDFQARLMSYIQQKWSTQKESERKQKLAKDIKVSYETIRKWWAGEGEHLPDGSTLLAIQNKTGISINWLLTGKTEIDTAVQKNCLEPEIIEKYRCVTLFFKLIKTAYKSGNTEIGLLKYLSCCIDGEINRLEDLVNVKKKEKNNFSK